MGNRLRTEYSNFFMLTFRTNPVCSLDYGPGLALNSRCTPVWRLRAHILYFSTSKRPSPVGDTSELIVFNSEPACETARIHSRRDNVIFLFFLRRLVEWLMYQVSLSSLYGRGRCVKITATGEKAWGKHHNVNVLY